MFNGMRTCMSSLGLETKTKLGKTEDTWGLRGMG